MNTKQINAKSLQIANIIAVVAVIVMNILSSALPLNGRSVESISDALPSYFTPAGYTFAIWGLIYSALLGFGVYQALPAQRTRPFLAKIGGLFVLSTVFNIGWLFAWHYGVYLLSVAFMVALLVTLIAIYLRLDIGRRSSALTTADKLFYQAPFSLYLGWITVATIANVASVANYFGWNGFGIAQPIWSAIMMAVAVVVAGVLLINRRNLAYAGVLVWALFGIRAAYPDVAVVANTAVLSAALVVVLALLGYWRTRRMQVTAVPQPRAA
ncbi:MAG: tryptophan-rich sensory protein [Chloroflexi bacterium]|nr:tryptophan-rich sensory protein [Chloroflexota bacterium]